MVLTVARGGDIDQEFPLFSRPLRGRWPKTKLHITLSFLAIYNKRTKRTNVN